MGSITTRRDEIAGIVERYSTGIAAIAAITTERQRSAKRAGARCVDIAGDGETTRTTAATDGLGEHAVRTIAARGDPICRRQRD